MVRKKKGDEGKEENGVGQLRKESVRSEEVWVCVSVYACDVGCSIGECVGMQGSMPENGGKKQKHQ